MTEEQVILVDEQDNPIGLMPKMEAHEKAQLHRAFSVFVFNNKNELMLQQRAHSKYHSPLLWTNTCCSHQRDGEDNISAGKRRLQEEMGFSCELQEVFSFIYKAPFDNGLTEHELDHVMIGYFNDEPTINKEEAEAYKWMSLEDVKKDIELHPEQYTAWFKIIFEKSYNKIANFKSINNA
ncbi:isopentenyl-diphosphate Delta-isomerase [Tenacibaculum geojense]|uniref:Isopentenyl-diphosphate delta-isomerase n=1 Tax=Tenacibaculum geojense TaxID=915352 RepID=A0ABW3JMS0_9FLAO